MKYLLDTCALVFLANSPQRLSQQIRDELDDAENTRHILLASAWEVACAARRRRLALNAPWEQWFLERVAQFRCEVLPVSFEQIVAANALPDPIHEDPIDRLIIAAARIHAMTVVTTDNRIRMYPHVHSAD